MKILRFPDDNIIKLDTDNSLIIPINHFSYIPFAEIPNNLRELSQKQDYNFTKNQLISKRDLILYEFKYNLSDEYYNKIFFSISNKNSCMLKNRRYEFNDIGIFKKYILVNTKNSKVVGRFFYFEKGNFAFNPYVFGYKTFFAYLLLYPVLKYILKSDYIEYKELGGGVEKNIYINDIIYDKKRRRNTFYNYRRLIMLYYRHDVCKICQKVFYDIDELFVRRFHAKGKAVLKNLRELKGKSSLELSEIYRNLFYSKKQSENNLLFINDGFICSDCAEKLLSTEIRKKMLNT
ncbi:MAG: hypothetical protein QXF61_11475 [Nitrososphaeria archaeon]